MKNLKIYSLLFAFFVLAVMPASVFAGDFATLNFIGFSEDGKYLAFEEYGTQDGSGFPYSNYYFVETAKNSYAAAPVKKFTENETISENAIRLQAKKAAAVNLRKFKIAAGNTGTLLVARLPTDIDVQKIAPGSENKDQTIKFYDEEYECYGGDIFELGLKTSKANAKRCEDYGFDFDILKFELSLKTNGVEEKILQKDKDLPESRGCPHTYSVQNVYSYKNQIAVFVNIYKYGFEGPDMRYMVVTGNYR
jgi:predicted secreted protein